MCFFSYPPIINLCSFSRLKTNKQIHYDVVSLHTLLLIGLLKQNCTACSSVSFLIFFVKHHNLSPRMLYRTKEIGVKSRTWSSGTTAMIVAVCYLAMWLRVILGTMAFQEMMLIFKIFCHAEYKKSLQNV